MIRYIVKHFDYKEEDIAKGKYDAWDLILPFWDNVSTYPVDENVQELDYLQLLKLMIILIIKINEEFCLKNQ